MLFTLRFVFVSTLLAGVATGCGANVVLAPSGDAGPDVAPVDAIPADVARTCITTADCPTGQECLVHEGCDTPSYCGPQLGRPCTDDLAPFCGCDGTTFTGSSTCPQRSFARRGPCETRPDAGPVVCRFSDGRTCAVGARCPAPDGCNTCTCDPSGDLQCTLLGCVDAGPPPDVITPRSCRASGDCPPSMMCDGPMGCDTLWTCVPQRGCTADLAPFCGCDGRTFRSSSSCVGQPYSRRGECPGTDGGLPSCSPQDARGEGDCDGYFGAAWNGTTCQSITGCRCVGAACSSLFTSLRACIVAYGHCSDG